MLEFKDGTCICGTVKVGERGQVVIPKKARDHFGIKPGDTLVVFGDTDKGITLFKADSLEMFSERLLASANENKKSKN